MAEIKLSDDQRKQILLEMKAVTRRIEDEVRILTSAMDDLGQTDIHLLINGWVLNMERVAPRNVI